MGYAAWEDVMFKCIVRGELDLPWEWHGRPAACLQCASVRRCAQWSMPNSICSLNDSTDLNSRNFFSYHWSLYVLLHTHSWVVGMYITQWVYRRSAGDWLGTYFGKFDQSERREGEIERKRKERKKKKKMVKLSPKREQCDDATTRQIEIQ